MDGSRGSGDQFLPCIDDTTSRPPRYLGGREVVSSIQGKNNDKVREGKKRIQGKRR